MLAALSAGEGIVAAAEQANGLGRVTATVTRLSDGTFTAATVNELACATAARAAITAAAMLSTASSNALAGRGNSVDADDEERLDEGGECHAQGMLSTVGAIVADPVGALRDGEHSMRFATFTPGGGLGTSAAAAGAACRQAALAMAAAVVPSPVAATAAAGESGHLARDVRSSSLLAAVGAAASSSSSSSPPSSTNTALSAEFAAAVRDRASVFELSERAMLQEGRHPRYRRFLCVGDAGSQEGLTATGRGSGGGSGGGGGGGGSGGGRKKKGGKNGGGSSGGGAAGDKQRRGAPAAGVHVADQPTAEEAVVQLSARADMIQRVLQRACAVTDDTSAVGPAAVFIGGGASTSGDDDGGVGERPSSETTCGVQRPGAYACTTAAAVATSRRLREELATRALVNRFSGDEALAQTDAATLAAGAAPVSAASKPSRGTLSPSPTSCEYCADKIWIRCVDMLTCVVGDLLPVASAAAVLLRAVAAPRSARAKLPASARSRLTPCPPPLCLPPSLQHRYPRPVRRFRLLYT